MKKFVSALLVFVLLISQLATVYAADTAEYERVLGIVKSRIGSTEEYTEFSGEEWEHNNNKRYSFNWSTDADDEYRHISVEATPDGIITSYYKSDNRTAYEPTIKKIPTDEALEKAVKLVAALNPDIADKLVITRADKFERLYGNTYNFNIERYENGIPVPENSGSVRLNSDCTQITSFNINYDSAAVFAAPENMISTEEAISAYGEKLGLYLSYKYRYDEKTRSVYLSYTPQKRDSYIDALTGEVFTPTDYAYEYLKNEAAADTTMMSGGAGGGFTRAEMEGLERIDGLISKEEAEKALRESSALAIGNDAEISSQSLNKDYYDKNNYTYSFNFKVSDGVDAYSYYYATVNATDGRIVSFSSPRKYPGEEAVADSIALSSELLPSLAGDRLDEYKLQESEDESDATLSYVRIINGIEFENNRIRIISDPEANAVISYSMSYDNVTAPSPDGIISEADALVRLTEQAGYFPAYRSDINNNYRLVYMLGNDTPSEIDAFSGMAVSNGEEYKEHKPAEYTDIDGHYAQEYIETLASYDIALDGDTFRPDEDILQKDYVAYLASAFGGYTSVIPKAGGSYDEVYRRADDLGILAEGEKNPDAPVTREMAAVYMIRAMGAEKYAKIDGIYKSPFPDVTNNTGYISILCGLGVIKGDENGLFNPQKHISRADSAIMIYGCLAR